ncbi:MAG: ATP-binding protein [Clostridia bacterium]
MFKSILSKLMSAYFLIILLTFIIVGVLLFGMLGDYATSEKEEVLKYTGEKVGEMTTVLVQNNTEIVEKLYRINLEAYSTNTQSIIFVVDQTGEIFAISNSFYKYIEGKKLSKEQYGDVLLGKDMKKIGNFGGMFNQTVLTIGVPIKLGYDIVGGVFLSTTTPEINRVRYDIFRLFMVAVVIAMIAAFMLIFFLSKRISRPLKMINKAAKTIANGQFENRVTVESRDEVGELAKTFNSMAESLQNLEDMRRSFIANVSHELRTPMTTIRGFIEGIMDGTIPQESQEKYLAIVLDEAKRISRLVTDLLDLAKMEAGERPLDIREFDINELIRVSIIKLESRFTQKDIHVNANFEDEYCYVAADMDSIQRVIMNLLDNAIKFTESKGTIEINIESKGNKIYISMKDNGIGIQEQELKYIWDRFYKTDKSRSKDKIGTGLGLAIVRSIIQQHGEEIFVDSKLDEYTKFTFTLKKS